MIRKIAQIQKRLTNIDAEIQQLNTPTSISFGAKADEAERRGGDLLEEMASQAEQQIEAAKERLATVNKNLDA